MLSTPLDTTASFALCSHEELGRETAFGTKNLKISEIVFARTAGDPVLSMSPSRNDASGRPATFSRIDLVSLACRPMADYLFKEALGAAPSENALRAAKEALMPLRGHSGRIGWAVMTLLEGGETKVAYEDAVAIVLRAARGARGGDTSASDSPFGHGSIAPVTTGATNPSGKQLVLPGFDG
jgi:hypothetical protein